MHAWSDKLDLTIWAVAMLMNKGHNAYEIASAHKVPATRKPHARLL